MSVSVSKTLLFPSVTNIKFSQLRSSFKETTSGSVSASELRRNTNTSNSNPIVPDATENVAVSTLNNLKLSQFRNTIKYYNLNQTGTDLNLDLFAQTWNSNLSKTIVKKVSIGGTCASSSVSSAALTFNALVYNLRVIVNGFVYGGGGSAGTSGNGGNGGNAMSLTSLGGAINILTAEGSQVYGGGGGGAKGATGSNGTVGKCSYVDTYTTGTACNSCPGCNPGYSQSCYRVGGCGRKNRGSNNQSSCSATLYYDTSAPAGGAGGNGGVGQGYNQTRTNGSAGSAGSTSSCSPNTTVTETQGNTGETGGNGSDWGLDGSSTTVYNGGIAGRAVTGSNYIIDSNSVTSAFKGLK